MKSFFNVLKNFVNYKGRANRIEVWNFILYSFFIVYGLSLIVSISGGSLVALIIYIIFCSLIIIYNIALLIRRMHDVGKSGWFILFSLIPIYNFYLIYLIYLKKGDYDTNKYGPVSEKGQSLDAAGAVLCAFIASIFVYKFIMGNPVNFEGGNPAGHPMPGNYLAMIYKGGMIVPLLMTCVLTLIIFIIERFIMIGLANGKGKINIFVRTLQNLLASDQIEEAQAECDKQKGSLANVMKAGLGRYRDLQNDPNLEKDQKILAIQKELEEATALELPMLSKNLVILSTLASISVLIGLIGTVLGMIRAFAALATAGSPDALALATGISEALINTAFGITGSTLAIIFYNYFSTRIDSFTFKIDEAGFSLVQTFASKLKR